MLNRLEFKGRFSPPTRFILDKCQRLTLFLLHEKNKRVHERETVGDGGRLKVWRDSSLPAYVQERRLKIILIIIILKKQP